MLENLTFELPKTGFLGTDHHRMNRHLFALLSLLRYALFKEKASKLGCLKAFSYQFLVCLEIILLHIIIIFTIANNNLILFLS